MSVPDAIVGLTRAAVDPAVLYDGHVPKDPATTRYAVIYINTGQAGWGDVGHTSDQYEFRWQVTAVGATREQAAWVADRARSGLVDQRPDVPGWACGLIGHVNSEPIRWDTDIPDRVVLYGADWYELTASKET